MKSPSDSPSHHRFPKPVNYSTGVSNMNAKTTENLDLLDFDWDVLDFCKVEKFVERKPEVRPEEVKPEDKAPKTELLF
jgi:hypothetical protein